MAEQAKNRVLTADNELQKGTNRFSVVLLWLCGKAANCQLTDIPQAAWNLGEEIRSKSTPAIDASRNLRVANLNKL